MTPRARATRVIAGALALVFVAGCSARSGSPPRLSSAYVSHIVCSYVFVSGLDPARVDAEDIAGNPVFNGFHWAMRHEVIQADRAVTARTLGGFESRAVYRDGLGCLNLNGSPPPVAPTRADIETDGPIAALLPDIAGPEVVAPDRPGLKKALDDAFSEPAGKPVRNTHAIVIVHDGRVIAERYAPGFGIDTPVHGWSATKSVNNALLGILVRQGKLKMEDPAPVAAWQAPGDPRRAITPDDLLRMRSGLDLGNSLSASLLTAWDSSARMVFYEPDLAGFAEQADLGAKPGTEWKYTNGNPAILARIVRDQVGGSALDVLRFARRELFGPLGIRRATLELDSTGTPIAGAFLFATPREWARFGVLFLDDGVVGGRRGLGALFDHAHTGRLDRLRRRLVDQQRREPRRGLPPKARHAARGVHGDGHLRPDGRRRPVPAARDRPLRNHLRPHDGDGRHLSADRRHDQRALAFRSGDRRARE